MESILVMYAHIVLTVKNKKYFENRELLFQMSLINSRLHFENLRLIINADISFVIYPRFLCQFLCHGKLFRNVPMTEYYKKISRSINMIFPIKAMIFDADGVLLDSLSVWKELGKRYITDLGYQPVAGMDEILFSMSMEQGAAWLKSRFTLEYSEEKIVMDLKARIRKYYFEEVPAKSGARELLQCLAEQKIPAAVATSSPREHICRALERNGLLSFFDKIYTTSEIGESKHSPKVYFTAAVALGSEPSRTLVVEDSLYALQTAGKAGLLTAGIYDALGEPDQEQLKKDAYIYCRDLTELQNHIFTENGGNQR